jgi:preprotein translocase subunit SecY
LFFTYFYTAVSLNIPDMCDNIKKYGGFIPGLRPGKPTTLIIWIRFMNRITLAGAIFLAFIAIMPNLIVWLTGISGSLLRWHGAYLLLLA